LAVSVCTKIGVLALLVVVVGVAQKISSQAKSSTRVFY
jgi:hypothetical protein